MKGKLFGVGIVVVSLLVGATVYYLQVYAYYRPVKQSDPGGAIALVALDGGQPEEIVVDDYRAIDADSSPLRFRACFTTPMSLAMMTETYRPAENPTPLLGPSWFDCYDARAIGEALERGDAVAFLSQHDIHPGVDRLVAVFADGRGYAWQQLNGEIDDRPRLE
jgi:hypothetical protein